MLKASLLLSIVFHSLFASGQNNVNEWDKVLRQNIKGKLKKITVGNRSTGFATFYFKSDKSVFSVEKREEYKTGTRTDSSSSFSANFRNDTLFRIVIRRHTPIEKQGRVIIYLDGNKVLAQDVDGKVFIPEVSKIMEEAYQLLLNAKKIIKINLL